MQRDQAVKNFARQTPEELFRSLLGFREVCPFTAQTSTSRPCAPPCTADRFGLRIVPLGHAERSMTQAGGGDGMRHCARLHAQRGPQSVRCVTDCADSSRLADVSDSAPEHLTMAQLAGAAKAKERFGGRSLGGESWRGVIEEPRARLGIGARCGSCRCRSTESRSTSRAQRLSTSPARRPISSATTAPAPTRCPSGRIDAGFVDEQLGFFDAKLRLACLGRGRRAARRRRGYARVAFAPPR